MKIKIKTIEVFGERSVVRQHPIGGDIYLYPKGTKRKVKALNIPSFKMTIEMQEAIIDTACDSHDCINYNEWHFI